MLSEIIIISIVQQANSTSEINFLRFMKIFPDDPLSRRLRNPVSALTAYDYPTARICDDCGVQIVLVGDSLGMVVAGNPDTTSVTLEQMVYHTEMVRRGVRRAVLVSDLPARTYDEPGQALDSARRLVAAGADAVKLEGGTEKIDAVRAITGAGIALCGHLGMLPQQVQEEGGYKKKGKTDGEAAGLLESARALEEAGAFAIILESVVPAVAERITAALRIPTIGIGSGDGCDGQIRVIHDVIGAFPWFVPPFAKTYGDVAGVIRNSVNAFIADLER